MITSLDEGAPNGILKENDSAENGVHEKPSEVPQVAEVEMVPATKEWKVDVKPSETAAKALEAAPSSPKKQHEPLMLTWKDLSVEVEEKKGVTKKILKNISGSIPAGQFVAIMGPSGAGKTTLLDVLSGRLKKGVTGSVEINGKERSTDASIDFRQAYVQQDDSLMAFLKVTTSWV